MKIEENKYNNTHQIQNRGKTHNNLSLAPTLSSSPQGHGIQLGYTTGIVYSVHIRQWYFNSTHKVHRTCHDLQYNMDKKQVLAIIVLRYFILKKIMHSLLYTPFLIIWTLIVAIIVSSYNPPFFLVVSNTSNVAKDEFTSQHFFQ